jgi:hypothetical protein
MSTKLEQLLADIDPSKTYDQTIARADDAINSFSGTFGQITDWDKFNQYMAEFTAHVEAKILQLHPCPIGLDFYWSKCVQLLCHIYGSNGEKAAFEMARTGNEGGLFSVLRTVALKMAEEYAENEIGARISDYWKKLTLNERLSITDEYLEKYGQLLPSELTEGSAIRIRANFPKVLAQHPEIFRKIRRLGR